MSNKIKAYYNLNKSKISNSISIILFLFLIPIINLFTKTLFNLGIYTGTFIRFLYEILTY